jgi:predicted permease
VSASRLASFLRTLFRWRQVEGELAAEWQLHVELRAEALAREGMPTDAALKRARAEFGDQARWREDVRQARGLRWVDEALRDVQYGWRQMRQAPGFAVVVVATLALGIGATTAIFTIVNGVLFEPLPYASPQDLVIVWTNNTRESRPAYPMSPADYLAIRESVQETAQLEAMNSFLNSTTLQAGSGAERITTSAVTDGMFALLGRAAAVGRAPAPGDRNVAVLSDGFWTRRFGRDPAIIGSQVRLDDVPTTIAGVMPADFKFPFKGLLGPSGFVTALEADAWIVIDQSSPAARFLDDNRRVMRRQHFLSVVGRLRPGANAAQLAVRARAAAASLEQQFPDDNRGMSTTVASIHEQAFGSSRPALMLLFGGVAAVLLIVCVNVGNLLFARSVARQHELAVRGALGARRGRVMRQLLVESLMLAGAGGALGTLAAFAGVRAVLALAPADFPRLSEISPNGRVMLFAVATSLLSGLIVGVAPATTAGRLALADTLKDASRALTASRGRRRLRGWLVSGELALALVLTLVAGLFVRSFGAVLDVAPGFRPDHLLTLQISVPMRLTAADARSGFYRDLFARIGALPGVQTVGGTTRLPLGSGNVSTRVSIEGRGTTAADLIEVEFRRALHDYFGAMGIPVVHGRQFVASDGLPNAEPVAMVNQSMARLWPSGDPVGQHVRMGASPTDPWLRVVGVIADVRHSALDAPPAPELYISSLQNPPVSPFIVVRTSGDPAAIAPSLRAELHAFEPDMPVFDMRTMADVRSASVASRRFVVVLLVAFGAIALVLAAVGVYAVLSLTASERTHEIGIRRALGASPAHGALTLLAGNAALAAAGVAAGFLLFAGVAPLLRAQLFEVGTYDPETLSAVAVVLLFVALAASMPPAWRAWRVDPIIALRHD